MADEGEIDKSTENKDTVFAAQPTTVTLNWNLLNNLIKQENELTRKNIEMIKFNTNLSKAEITEWHNNLLRNCANNELSIDEFVENFEALYSNGNANNFSKNVFRVFDRKNSGTTIGLIQLKDPYLRFSIAFDLYDHNCTDIIDVNKLVQAISTLYDFNGVVDRKGSTWYDNKLSPIKIVNASSSGEPLPDFMNEKNFKILINADDKYLRQRQRRCKRP
ncbi:unnamed protein product [Adineta steineri]|uniref:Uncharacterized protein n=1 Tax=Adineta steineri TaxID=433720 RepID=A0A816EVB9_9BILA|nr:unnamed protein product [Adineta steineri]CAF1654295.1 unnamed protein product [Adineta steineri]